MQLDRSDKKIDLCYYGQVNSLQQKSNVDSEWESKHYRSNIYFAGDGKIERYNARKRRV